MKPNLTVNEININKVLVLNYITFLYNLLLYYSIIDNKLFFSIINFKLYYLQFIIYIIINILKKKKNQIGLFSNSPHTHRSTNLYYMIEML